MRSIRPYVHHWTRAAPRSCPGSNRIRPLRAHGLSAQDEILAIDDVRVTARTLADVLAPHRPADVVKVVVSRRGSLRDIEVVLGQRTERSFRITLLPDPTPLQTAILGSWLRN